MEKAIFNSIPLFYMSLFKALVCVCGEIEKITRRFIRGGVASSHKISWISLDVLCRSQHNGSLGLGWLRWRNHVMLFK